MKRRFIAIILVLVALVAVVVGIATVRGRSVERAIRASILDAVRPVALQNCTLARFGSANDGGYLMCENLIESLGAGYSYGVGLNDDWGCDMSTRYSVPVHQYDCFDPARPVCSTGQFVFHDECIARRREIIDARTFDTLANQIAQNGDNGKRLIVKIDIEGAEWDSLLAAPDEVLQSIDQLPMELHVPRRGLAENGEKILSVLDKLKRQFYVVNINFNNHGCSPRAAPLPARAFQVLFVNKRIGVLDPNNGTPPRSPLNAPDDPKSGDCQLAVANP